MERIYDISGSSKDMDLKIPNAIGSNLTPYSGQTIVKEASRPSDPVLTRTNNPYTSISLHNIVVSILPLAMKSVKSASINIFLLNLLLLW
jgi:hypothetical protein